jgi:multiple sugar transport system ATP-binding protein
MGRAIVRDPKVFLFDEPLSNLDAKLRVQMRTEIKKVHQTVKTTTVYVTHDQVEAMTLADRVVVMNHGVIEQVGPPQELYHSPKTRFVAGFIGSPAMNFIPARVENGSGALRLNLPNGIVLPVPAERTGRYSGVAGKEVLFGIRPEHLTEPKNLDRANIATFELTPEVIEPMGMETLLHLWMQGHEVCSRIDPTTPAEPGRPMQVAADLNHMHIIDPESGRVL